MRWLPNLNSGHGYRRITEASPTTDLNRWLRDRFVTGTKSQSRSSSGETQQYDESNFQAGVGNCCKYDDGKSHCWRISRGNIIRPKNKVRGDYLDRSTDSENKVSRLQDNNVGVVTTSMCHRHASSNCKFKDVSDVAIQDILRSRRSPKTNRG